ncbi:MAG TPA: hypothetical protein DIW31_05670 [Bacteroidales bacterium]|nr:hypothetical protein [Bacteroidales bacterium]
MKEVELNETFYFKLKNASNGRINDENQLLDIRKNAIEMLIKTNILKEDHKTIINNLRKVKTDYDFSNLFNIYDKYYDDKDNLKDKILILINEIIDYNGNYEVNYHQERIELLFELIKEKKDNIEVIETVLINNNPLHILTTYYYRNYYVIVFVKYWQIMKNIICTNEDDARISFKFYKERFEEIL